MHIARLITVLRRFQGTPPGYFAALMVFVLAIGVRELVDPFIQIPYVTLFPAMVICSLKGGRLGGILCAAIGGLVASYFWVPPRHSFALQWPTGHLSVLLYVVTSTILLLLTRGLNETLTALERERDLSAELFRELQHRTANNLQNVSALLRQNRRTVRADPRKAEELIETAERRFEIMSRINRRLYSPEMRQVGMSSYLESLCRDMLDAMGNPAVVVVVRPSPITLRRETAMLVSLVVAELMINANKHAFASGQVGAITLSLEQNNTHYRLTFADNGKGLPKGFDFANSAGLGGRIVMGLVNQLKGTLHTGKATSGTSIEVVFPADQQIHDGLTTGPAGGSTGGLTTRRR